MNEWWKKGVFLAGGWHPLAAQLRRTVNQSSLLEEQYPWNYTEERVRHLVEAGVDLVICQFDRGLGDSDAKQEHENSRILAGLCHQYGIRHGAYLANSVYFESMLKDYPDCEDWVMHNSQGKFVYYGGEQTFRWIVCFNSPPWRERMKKIIAKAIFEIKTDLLHFDNLAVWPEPDSCHCHWCQERFRSFLKERYPSQGEQIARFGFTGFDTFRIPEFNHSFQPAWTFERYSNPLIQDFIDFRCETVTDYIRELASYARGLSPDIIIDSNGQFIGGENRAFLYGADANSQLSEVEAAWNENSDYRPDSDPDRVPRVMAKVRGMKQFRQLGKCVFSAFSDAESLAFNLVFGGSPGIYTDWGYGEGNWREQCSLPEDIARLLVFFRQYRYLFGVRRTAARVGVWRSRQTLRYNSGTAHLAVAVFEQLLLNHQIPFTIVGDDEIEMCDLLIVPEVEYLSLEMEYTITGMVKNGKSVFVVGASGVFLDSGRRRTWRAFGEIFGEKKADTALMEQTFFDPARSSLTDVAARGTVRNICFGRGQAVYLPNMDYRYMTGSFPPSYNIHYRGIDSRYWKEPSNAGEILELIRQLPACAVIPQVRGAEYIYTELLADCLMIFRANAVTPVELTLNWASITECRVVFPESPEVHAVRRSADGNFHLPAIGNLGIVIPAIP